MSNKNVVFLALSVTIVCGIAGAFLLTQPAAPKADLPAAKPRTAPELAQPQNSTPAPAPTAVELATAAVSSQTPTRPSALSTASAADVQKLPPPAGPAPNQGDPLPQDELARVALSFVGTDPEAEAYWVEAINDPSLSADERQNLIEDLNEDGLSDPKNPSPADLPLIVNRIALIGELARDPMDKVNADAFAEAYKDLTNLANVATGGGEPVK